MLLHPAFRNLNLVPTLAALALSAIVCSAPARAQQPVGIMAAGDTIVTGFSGTVLPPPGVANPVDETFINLDGASMRIQRPAPNGPPSGQLIPAPTVFQAPARAVGQTFAITLDDATVPNIYLGATSIFGLQIVTPDNDGDGRPERVKNGQTGASFMNGQWGAGGTAGSIYRVDGVTGQITLLTTIGANAGPGIGDLIYDKASRQFFASDLDTGLIYRFDATGTILDTFDHGQNGRPAKGLPPVADDNSTMSVTSPAFNSEDPATWGYTQKERMVWGLAIQGGRVYYAADAQIYSIGIDLDGKFAGDARWEFDITGPPGTNWVSDIVFDSSGRIILAQRGAQRGSYDYSVFAEPAKSSVLRYRREIPDNPATAGFWVPVPEQYAIGFRPDGRNANGGVALGYGYDAQGRVRNGACYQTLWSTGESLRDNPALAAQLAAGGPAIVHGLQANDESLVRPANDPPFSSYFTDYDGTYDDPVRQGHLGDVEIFQPCASGFGGYLPPWIPPPGWVPPGRDTFNLKLDKRAFDCVNIRDSFLCGYTVRVSNAGTTPYFGPITVDDWLPAAPAGATMAFAFQPPWTCVSNTATSYSCTHWPVWLLPGDAVDLYVLVRLPASYRPCVLDNAARIAWPWGWGDQNPLDDFDSATAKIPGERCDPPRDRPTNLTIRKDPVTPVCADAGANWVCTFLITITNTGPGVFNGPIAIQDTLSVPGLPLAITPPWACVGGGPYTCSRPPVNLLPGASTFLLVQTSVSKAAQFEAGRCSIVNRVRIATPAGGTPQNTNGGDDADDAEMLTPGRNCDPSGRRSDLSIRKEAKGCVNVNFNDRKVWLCGFAITVKNEGPNAFNAPITIRDTMTPVPLPPSPAFLPTPWLGACVGGGGVYTCNSPGNVFIPAGASLAPLNVVIAVPDNGQVCRITNQARITAPLGAPRNTNAFNDVSANVVVNIPSEKCEQPPLVAPDVCPVERRMPIGGCCPIGSTWNGRACSGGQTVPVCPAEQAIPGGGCCPAGQRWNGQVCAPPSPPQTCPQGFVGTPPNCRPVVNPCPQGQVRNAQGICVPVVQPCPQGTVRNNLGVCVPVVQPCPPGTIRDANGRCVLPPCPPGMVRNTAGQCVPPACPQGQVRNAAGQCVPIIQPCPRGQIRDANGRCVTPPCPQGQVRNAQGQCVPVIQACPQGTVRNNLGICVPVTIRPLVCPQGTVGTPPNCRKPDAVPR